MFDLVLKINTNKKNEYIKMLNAFNTSLQVVLFSFTTLQSVTTP